MLLQDLRQEITNLINQSNLPIDAVYYVMKDIMNEVVEIYNQQLQQEQAEAAAQQSESEVKAEETEAAAQIEKKEEE